MQDSLSNGLVSCQFLLVTVKLGAFIQFWKRKEKRNTTELFKQLISRKNPDSQYWAKAKSKREGNNILGNFLCQWWKREKKKKKKKKCTPPHTQPKQVFPSTRTQKEEEKKQKKNKKNLQEIGKIKWTFTRISRLN